MANPGYSFTPGLANRFRSAVNGQAAPLGANATQALQILSLHLPDVIGGHAPAPDALLRGGSGLTPDAAVRAMASGQSNPQATVPPRPSPLTNPSPNQPPLSVSSPAPSLGNVDSAPQPEPSQEAQSINVNGGGSAPSPFPTQAPDPGPTPTQPNTAPIPAFRFKGPDQPTETQSNAPPNIDFQNLMDNLFGSSFGQAMGGFQPQNY